MKKILSVICLTGIMCVNTFASGIAVYVNNSKVNFSQPPVVENGATLVPVRGLLEKLGATVDWDKESETVVASLGASTVKMVIGSKTAYVDNKIVPLTVAPKIINGATMIPLRFVSENMGLKVDWNSGSKTIKVTDDSYKGFSPVPDFGKMYNLQHLSGSGNITNSGDTKIVNYTYDKSKVTDNMLKNYVKTLEQRGFNDLKENSSLYYSGEKNKKMVLSIDVEKNVVITISEF
ncbi:MAG: copper amine oxidase N-terminal domain-containing protein [Muribaculaceae bacterium]